MVKMAKMWFSGHVLAEKVNASTKFATFGNGPTFYMTIRIHPCMSLLNSIFCQLKCLGKHSELYLGQMLSNSKYKKMWLW